MVDKREKTISYRRAQWLEVSGLTLEKCVKEVHTILKSIDERTIVHGGQHTKSVKTKDGASAGGIFVHLTTETPGESTSFVPKATPGTAEIDLGTASPPPDGEWLDGDAFLYINDDHVCMCATGIRDGAVSYFLKSLFLNAKMRRDSIRFELMKVADITKLKLLQNQGVKELEIRAQLYKATADYTTRKAKAYGMVGAAAKHLKSFLKKPYDVTPDSLKVIVALRVDRRFTKSLNVGYKRIQEVASDVVKNFESGDEYTIITRTGQRIDPNEIFMRTKVAIDKEGKTVHLEKAWRELAIFFQKLKASGVVEQ